MSLLRRLGALFVLLQLAAVALATTLESEEAKCPVCTHVFTAFSIRSTNTFGGTDLDFCRHAAGEDPLSVAVWTCPGCRYSNWSRTFAKGVSAETAAWIRQGLEPRVPVAKDAHQLRIPGHVKYDLLLRILEKETAPAGERTTARRCAVWATRVEGSGLVHPAPEDPALAAGWETARSRYATLLEDGPEPSLEGIHGTRAELRAASALLAETRAPSDVARDTTAAELFVARVLRNRGENVDARPVAAGVAAREDAPASAREAAKRLVESIDAERSFQEALVGDLRALLDSGIPDGAERTWQRYTLAETLRRLGRTEDSRTAYRATLEDEPSLVVFRMSQRALSQSGDEFPAVRSGELWKKRVAAHVGMLSDPEQAERAGWELQFAAEASTVPQLLAALGSEEPRVRRHAARALEFVEAPSQEALDALHRVLLEETEEAPREAALRTLERWADPRSSGALVDALMYSNWVRRNAIDALGLVGDEASIPELVEVRKKDPGDVAEALELLTNRVHADAAAFDLWYEENRTRKRDEWVRAGFAEAGLAVPEGPWAREHLPLLIDWLGHAKPHVRGNAFRILRGLTGRRFGSDCLADRHDSPRSLQERRLAVRNWRRWAAEHLHEK